MYRAPYKSIFCLAFLVSMAAFAAPRASTEPKKSKRVKVRRACDSLRILARKHTALRARAKGALFKKREAEKVCREGFRTELPGIQVKPVNGSTCRALAKHKPKTPEIKAVLKRAGRLDRQANARCARTLKRLHAPKGRAKLGGNQ